MKFFMYAYHNKLGDFYGTIFLDKTSPDEMAKDLVQGLVSLKDDELDTLLADDLYCLGLFDNVTGEIVPAKDYVCDCTDAVCSIKANRKELLGSEGGKTDEC